MTETDLPVSPASTKDESSGESPNRPEPAFKDRKVGLAAFGVAQLLIAVAFLAISAVQFAMLAGTPFLVPVEATAMPRWALVWSGFFYLVLSGVAAVLGVGSIRCRRWARTITLVLASVGLAMGIASMAFVAFTIPAVRRGLESQAGEVAPGVGIVIGCMVALAVLVNVVVPAAFVLFYRSRHVKATCELYDREPGRLERRPLPVLAGSLLQLSGCAALITPLTGLGVPLFGWILTGPWAWLLVGVSGLLSVAVAWGLFNLRRWAWQAAIGLTLFSGVNLLVVTWVSPGLELYERLQMPTEQLEILEQTGFTRFMAPVAAASLALMLGFYVWLGKYFQAEPKN